jgi:NADPH:quinone reductase
VKKEHEMKAIRTDFEGVETVTVAEVPDPQIGAEEIEVEVKATALNRADVLQVCGFYPAPEGVVPDIPGLEYAGVVRARGSHATRFQVGDRVFGLVPGGAFAERLSVHQLEAMPIPEPLDFVHAAAVPEAFMTAWDALQQARVKRGDWVLIHAAASGVGCAAIQLVRALEAKSIGTSRTHTKLDAVKPLGLNQALLLADVFADDVKRLSGGGVQAVIDLIGGPSLAESVESMASGGTLVLVGLVAGPMAELPLRTLLRNRLTIVGTAMRSRSHQEKASLAAAFSAAVVPWLVGQKIKPVVDAVVPYTQAAQALGRLAANETIGKIVMTFP